MKKNDNKKESFLEILFDDEIFKNKKDELVEDDTTFNEIKERTMEFDDNLLEEIKEKSQEEVFEEIMNEVVNEKKDENIENNSKNIIMSSFPKIDRLGSVVPHKIK